jgi:hypothetical protein
LVFSKGVRKAEFSDSYVPCPLPLTIYTLHHLYLSKLNYNVQQACNQKEERKENNFLRLNIQVKFQDNYILSTGLEPKEF